MFDVISTVLFFQDETSAKKFRAISEAYEVLGNVKLKKMYDKGSLLTILHKC